RSIARALGAESLHFGFCEDARGLLGGVKDAGDERFVGGDAVALEPEEDVGLAAHRADLDDLVEAEKMGRDAAVDGVGEGGVFFVIGLDDGGGVDAGGGAEGVAADDGIIRRDRSVRGLGDFFAIFLEAGEVAVDEAHETEIDEHEFHWRIAHAFAERIGGGVNAVGASGYGPKRIGDGQAAIVVAVPIDADFFAAGLHNFFDGEFNQVVRALRRGVADGVAQNDRARTAADGGGVEALDGGGIGADGVFGDVHRGEVVIDSELDGFFGGALEMVDRPIFDEATNGAGAEEGGGFDGDAYALGDFGDGGDVGFDGASRGVGANLHAIAGDFAGEGFGVGDGAGTGTGK